jgi:hypothetical protein
MTAFVGLIPQQVNELVALFRDGEKEAIIDRLSEEAGMPWVRAFESRWSTDEAEARRDALFDLAWHRRARELDPIITAPDFAGFDTLLEVAEGAAPELWRVLRHIEPDGATNPRCHEGPAWWSAWHEATATVPGGWLDLEEVQHVWGSWSEITTVEVERACVEAMGATYTHPGCWGLLRDLSGFFAQCMSERRVALAEVDV